MEKHSQPSDTAPIDWISLTTRLRPDLHEALERTKASTGKSLNLLINEAVEGHLIPPGGAVRIARARRRLPVRPEPARAAAAYLLGYLGKLADARKVWPHQGRFTVRAGEIGDLEIAGGLIAAEMDRRDGRWDHLSVSPSGASTR